MAEAKGRWKVQDPYGLVQAISAVLAALSVVAAAFFYVKDRVLPIRIRIDPPVVIEFRCSSTRFDVERCFDREQRHKSHLSLSAAVRIVAIGPAVQSVTVEKATARVTYHRQSAAEPKPIDLVAFWTGNLTGGKGDFEQVVAQSISGGKTERRELWFMPVPGVACVPKGDRSCSPERDGFLPWHKFVGDIINLTQEGAEKNEVLEIRVDFLFEWRANDGPTDTIPITCFVDVGESAYAQTHEIQGNMGSPLWITLPCRRAPTSSFAS